MGNVTGINVDPELIETLEAMLESAKQGRMTGLLACFISDNEVDTEIIYGPHSHLEMVGMAHMLSTEIVNAFNEVEED